MKIFMVNARLEIKSNLKMFPILQVSVDAVERNSGFMLLLAVIGSKTRKGVFRCMCVGSLISKSFVIAVSHCVELTLWHVNAVRLGKNHSNAGGQEHEVKKVISHPQYDRWTSQNDIALVELAEDVTFTNFIRPACLQVTENFSEVSVEVRGRFITKTRRGARQVQTMSLSIQSHKRIPRQPVGQIL